MDRWKKYFHILFNEGYEILPDSDKLDIIKEGWNFNYYRWIQEHGVKEALKRVSNGKAVKPHNIPIEVWKSLGDRGQRKCRMSGKETL